MAHHVVPYRHALPWKDVISCGRLSFKEIIGPFKKSSFPLTVSSPVEDAKATDKIKLRGMVCPLQGYGEGKRMAGKHLWS